VLRKISTEINAILEAFQFRIEHLFSYCPPTVKPQRCRDRERTKSAAPDPAPKIDALARTRGFPPSRRARGHQNTVPKLRPRYALAAMVGVAPEDDDGNAASTGTAKTTYKKPVTNSQPSTSETVLKTQAEGYVRQIEVSETLEELNAVVSKNASLLFALHENLPQWGKRVSERINEQRIALSPKAEYLANGRGTAPVLPFQT